MSSAELARTARSTILSATIVAGTLDILSAFVFAGLDGIGPANVLTYVASGPFGDRAFQGAGWGMVGLLVHFAIMACMVGAYVLAARRTRWLIMHPVPSGLLYGLLLWVVMYWVVMPLRWPEGPRPDTLYKVANGLFSHCLLTGLPIALLAARAFGVEYLDASASSRG